MKRKSFGPLTQVLVNEKSRDNLPTDSDRETQVVLPEGSASPGGGGRDIGKFEYNTPDANSDIKPRTLGLPGEQYGHPSNNTYNTVTRRTMTGFLTIEAFMEELDLEEDLWGYAEEGGEDEEDGEYLKKRQKKQKGRKKNKSKQYYRKNKQKIKRKNKKWQQKNKQKIKRNRKRTKGKNRTRRNASVENVVFMYLWEK
jgi:hypothetical protein